MPRQLRAQRLRVTPAERVLLLSHRTHSVGHRVRSGRGRPNRTGYRRPMLGRRPERSAARVGERGIELLEEAAEQSRPRIVAERVVANTRWFVQAALATALH